jgi:hypothetical protein
MGFLQGLTMKYFDRSAQLEDLLRAATEALGLMLKARNTDRLIEN